MNGKMHRLLAAMLVLVLAGCATTAAPPPEERHPVDPWEPYNRNMYAFNRSVDKAVLRPAAQGYKRMTPGPIKAGVRNFFENLGSLPTILNLVLQGRLTDGGQALERFYVNTVYGVAGIFDVAGHAEMKSFEEDFGQTLARWGWAESRYFVMPLRGPSTLRDTVGMPVDIYSNVLWRRALDGRYYATVLDIVQTRAGLLGRESDLEQAYDEYLLVRDAWLQRRKYQIREETPTPDYDAYLEEDWDD